MRQPAGAAEGRRGEPAASRREAGGPKLPRPLVEDGVDLRREGGSLHRHLPVALDEYEEDVLPAQAGQQPAARRGVIAVAADRVCEPRTVSQAGLHRPHLLDGQVGGAQGGDARAGHELRAERPAEHPGGAECSHRLERLPAVAGRDPGQAEHGQGREDEREDGEQRHADQRQVRVRPTDRGPQRLDPDGGVPPVVDGVERPVEGGEEAEVEQLHDGQEAERRPTTQARRRRPVPGRTRASAMTTMPSSGNLTNAAGVSGWAGSEP